MSVDWVSFRSAILILTLAIIGGLIAYIGDRIGMRVGRRRLTLFGMRPRHTSILVTVTTGVLIAAGTFVALTVVSEDVRIALARIDEIKEALAAGEARYKASQERLERMQVLVDDLSSQIAEKTSELAATVAERDQAAAELMQTRMELHETTQRFAQAQQELERAQEELDAVSEDLRFQTERVEQLKEIASKLQGRLDELEQEEERLQEKVAYLLEQYGELQDQHEQLKQRMRFGNLAYRSGDIVHAAVLQPGNDDGLMRDRLLSFMIQANERALSRGARIPGKENYALQLYSEDHFEEVVATLTAQKEQAVVRAVAHANAMLGEPVQVRLEVYPRDLVFRAGQVIESVEISADESWHAEDEILELLRRVNSAALSLGMICDSQGRVGQVSGDEFLRVVAEVKQQRQSYIVEAVAAEDTWNTEGPLNITLRLREG